MSLIKASVLLLAVTLLSACTAYTPLPAAIGIASALEEYVDPAPQFVVSDNERGRIFYAYETAILKFEVSSNGTTQIS